GADGPGAAHTVLTLTNSAGGAFSAQTTNFFDTATGHRIFLYTDPTSGLVLGKVGSGTALSAGSADANAAIAFAIGIDNSGDLSFAQYRALLDNPNTANDPNDLVTLQTGGTNGTNAVYVTAVSTDFDGDTSPATTTALVIRVADDGPSASHVDAAAVLENANASVTLVAGHDFSFGTDGPGSVTFDTAHATITGPNGVTLGTPTYVINGDTIEVDPGNAFVGLAAGQSATVDVT